MSAIATGSRLNLLPTSTGKIERRCIISWTTPQSFTTGQLVDANDLNTDIRGNMRHLRGIDGTTELVGGVLLTSTGTFAFLRPPLLTQAQVDALDGSIEGRMWWNSDKKEAEAYGTAQEEFVTVPGTAVQGDLAIRTGDGWERLPAGTDGQILRTKAGTGNPIWDDITNKRSVWVQPHGADGAGIITIGGGPYAIGRLADGTTGALAFSLPIPTDFSALSKAVIVLKPGAGTGTSIFRSVTTNFAADGENPETHSDSISASALAITEDQMKEDDISAALTGIAAADYIGLKYQRQGGDGTDTFDGVIDILGFLIEYTT